ncbi:MAG: hypothetical protein LBK82_09630 [Planctomycetaceae bacterium]|jgi:squalene-hopene/tetraprenyl-beta-curcumene cyclase|nr:hypothetical protein [Planctomycetaceae bacterium]
MKRILFITILLFCLLFCATLSLAQDWETKRQDAINKAIIYLRTKQSDNGAFSPEKGIGPSALILCGLLDVGVQPNDPMTAKGLQFLENSTQEDGGIYTKGGFFQNYETCMTVQCFATANRIIGKMSSPESFPYSERLVNAQKYLLNEQFTETKGINPENSFYGGAGYGRHQRPDLSNTQFFLDALKAIGKNSNDPAIQKALIFISRCQNLESEHNTLPFASKNPDGGFIYTAATQQSMAGETPEGGLRSYASMTYAGLKSMIYAGLTKEDKRVKAAHEWLRKHYNIHENPGLGADGLFYYYKTMSKTLHVMQLDKFEDATGKKHNWRSDLVTMLCAKQRSDGSWINDTSKRWMEDDANLVTGFVLMVLADCKNEKMKSLE